MSNKCPKCGGKIKATYFKQTCPHCGVNLLYYKLDEQLEEDAKKAADEVEKVNRFVGILKASSVKTPWHIIRLILFFTPLLSMCLPMYYAGNKSVSLIGFILSIVNHGLHIDAWTRDYLFAVFAMVMVIVLSLAVIINSLFSATKRGYRRNVIFSGFNTAVFGAFSLLVCLNGGEVKIGFYLTMLLYALEGILHYVAAKPKTKRRKIGMAVLLSLCIVFTAICSVMPKPERLMELKAPANADIRVVSFNTAAPWGTPFDDTASKDRVERFADTVKNYQADLIGTQELNSAWLEKLTEVMPMYESYAVKRGGDSDENNSEMNGIFWKKDRFTALETNTFWLSETPEKESRYTYLDENGEQQEAGCNRICSYAILEDNESGERIAFLNTHLDNASEQAMNFGAELIISRINEIKKQYGGNISVVLIGDFNQTKDGAAYKTVSAVLNDATDWEKSGKTYQDWGYTDTGNEPIDFIFTNGEREAYEILDELPYGYVSDHYGIMADINF